MSRRTGRMLWALLGALAMLPVAPGAAADSQDIQRLSADLGGAEVSVHPATGTARFVRIPPGAAPGAAAARSFGFAPGREDLAQKSATFLDSYAGAFGLTGAGELTLAGSAQDRTGSTHLTYTQQYRGVPVFGAVLKTHFDAQGDLRVVNGVTVPGIDVDATPSRNAEEAGRAALARVTAQKGGQLSIRNTRLWVYRAGLLKGVRGPSHLAWEVEVGNGNDVREFVFVDAHVGKVIDQFTGVHDDLVRRAYDGAFLPNPPPSYPASPFWQEGQVPFPTGNVEADNMLFASQETYDLFFDAFGRDSWDGTGEFMDQIFNRGYGCPNASWNGTFISFCSGFTTDDVTGHEWGHAYTERTHGLIYAWQSGALNEAYSDIWGETVDRINARGANDPGPPRSADGANCSAFQIFPPEVRVNAPAGIAADYPSGTSGFSPIITSANTVTADVVRPNDGFITGSTATDGCCAGPTFLCAAGSWTNAADIAGKIVLVDRGLCGFAVKALNAQRHGAAGVIIANVATSANPTFPPNMGGVTGAEAVTIPTTSMNLANGNLLRTALVTDTVNATLQPNAPGATDPTNRWLMGEDVNAVGLVGALRDMWSPTCFGDPGKVTDAEYFCGTGDNGGVHSNSGVPNHGYALLVDGGTYDGQTIASIGLTKTAHIYFRAQSVYQGPASNFADHADALEQSCADLVGAPLNALTGGPSGEVISAADCAEVANAMAAVEMRTPPDQCGFEPILGKNPPDRCEAGTTQANVFFDNFESNPIGPWAVSHEAVTPEDFTPRDWVWTSALPVGRDGSALWGDTPNLGDCAADDESGVLHATSPVITLPPGAADPKLTFDHWVATEAGWDGANLKLSVDGGPWSPVSFLDYTYNPYNILLFSDVDGNTNPMAGEEAFSGTDEGSVSGSWGRSHLNLAPYAAPGQTIQLRFDVGNDGCTGFFGWYVDDPTLYACVPSDAPTISIGDVSVTEGNSGFTDANLTVSLSHASASPVSVWYFTWIGSAWPFFDFVPKVDKLTIPPLHLQGTITIKVRGDRHRERDEHFPVFLFLPAGGAILDGEGTVTIINDDGGHH